MQVAAASSPSSPPLRYVHRPAVSGLSIAPSDGGRNWSLWDQTNAVAAIVGAIDGAKQVVTAEYFQITPAGKGAAVTDALLRAARRGVEVNVIADITSQVTLPLGSFERFRRTLIKAGGNVVVTAGFELPRRDKVRSNFVDHRKVVTIDGHTGFIGGMNLARVSDQYHDSMLQLGGIDAARLGVEELDRWTRVGGTRTAAHRNAVLDALDGESLTTTDPDAMQIVVNAPDYGRYELSNAYRDAIRGAQHRLWVSSPGYSSQELMEELSAAVKRGVDVQFVASGAPPAGLPFVNWVSQSHLAALVKEGATATMIPEVLHRKVLIADDTALLSSFNITERSRQHDHEIGVRSSEPEFVRTIAALLEKDIQRGKPLDPATRSGFSAWLGDLIAHRIRISY